MKERFWPWKRIAALECRLKAAEGQVKDLSSQVERHQREAVATGKHLRKMATIIAIKGGNA